MNISEESRIALENIIRLQDRKIEIILDLIPKIYKIEQKDIEELE